MHSFYFIERLSVVNALVQIFPKLLKGAKPHIYVFDASPLALWVTQKLGKMFGVTVEKFHFRLVDVKDETDLIIRVRIDAQDVIEVRDDILASAPFQKLLADGIVKDRMFTFLKKTIGYVLIRAKNNLSRALYLVQVCYWAIQRKGAEQKNPPLLFLNRRFGQESMRRYGSRYNIDIDFLLPMPSDYLRGRFLSYGYRVFLYFRWWLKHPFSFRKSATLSSTWTSPKVAIEIYDHFNLNQPELYSDFFFYQQSKLKGDDVMAFFNAPLNPLDEEKLKTLQQHGLGVLALDPRATNVSQYPPLKPFRFKSTRTIKRSAYSEFPIRCERVGIKNMILEYERARSYWRDIFERSHAKIYLSWYKYDGLHCIIADALKDVGGVMALYQRALDVSIFGDNLINVDISFAYSHSLVADLERKLGSKISYFVATGYLGDHRFSLLKPKAEELRKTLNQNGAQFILSFTDENSANDPRWHTGHEFMQVNYQFLLEKVLTLPRLGLVLKPKRPVTLRKRLGPVAKLLDEALATGRCYLFDDAVHQSNYPPALAALAADLVIHGHLCAPTASLECALTGKPTLLLDRESCPISPLYRLGVGQVVFRNWEDIWDASLQYWKNPKGITGFGDWSGMIDQLDPFRDGRAAERMGTYLQWMIEGFKAGLNRDTVMADAAERYCKQWGSDKVLSFQ